MMLPVSPSPSPSPSPSLPSPPLQSSLNIINGVDSSPTEYIFSYSTGSPISVSTGSTPQCNSSSCQHTFRVTSSQVQQYTVTVAARNVVGLGTASTPVTVGMWLQVYTAVIIGMQVLLEAPSTTRCAYLPSISVSVLRWWHVTCKISHKPLSHLNNLDKFIVLNTALMLAISLFYTRVSRVQPTLTIQKQRAW